MKRQRYSILFGAMTVLAISMISAACSQSSDNQDRSAQAESSSANASQASQSDDTQSLEHTNKLEPNTVSTTTKQQGMHEPPVAMELHKVSEHVYYVKGAAGAATDNHGFISNASVIVSEKGIIVFDALGSPALARMLREKIREISDQSVIKVIVSHYHADHIYGLQTFVEEGAEVIAPAGSELYLHSDEAKRTLVSRKALLSPWLNDLEALVEPDIYIFTSGTVDLGDVTLDIIYNGSAHSYGDQSVYVREDGVLLIGDLIFEGRVPFVGNADTAYWLEKLIELETGDLKAMVPGHGAVSYQPKDSIRLTRRYLQFLRREMKAAVEEFIPFAEVYDTIDWQAFENLPAFEAANRRNAYQVYLSLEAELMAENP